MKLTSLFLLIFFFVSIWFCEAAYTAQTLFNEIERNISVEDKVIRLNLPMEGVRFGIVWVTSDGKQWKKNHFARKGDHAYEMRDHPAWKGKVQTVAVTMKPTVAVTKVPKTAVTEFQNISGKVKKPVFKDEIDIFLAPEQWVSNTINLLYGHTFLGWSWNTILVLLALLSAFALYFYRVKSLVVSLLFGFIIAWVAMDLRTMIDHFYVVDKIEDNQSVNLIKDLKTAGNILAEKIGTGTWTQKDMTWPHINVINYTLAEHQYVPYQSDSKADFLIIQRGNQIFLLNNIKK